MMNFAAFALSTLALLQAAAGASAIETSQSDVAVREDAVPAAKQAFLFEDIFLGEDRSDGFKDCKSDCIDKKCKSAKSGDNTCKTKCKKKCDKDSDYSGDSKDRSGGSGSGSKDRSGGSDSGSSDDESDQFKQCKKACKVANCKGDISSGDELDRCKDACKDGCSSNDNYSDFSSSFTFNSGDVFASGDGDAVVPALASRRNLPLKQAFLFEDIFLGEDRSDGFKDCKSDCIDKKCKSAKSGDNTCKTKCKKKCDKDSDYSGDSKDRSGGSGSGSKDRSGGSDSGSSDDESDQFKQCKKACKVANCKGDISSGDELDRCKDACKDGCSSNDNYSDFSSSFTFNSGDAFASADGDAGLQALAARRNLRQRRA